MVKCTGLKTCSKNCDEGVRLQAKINSGRRVSPSIKGTGRRLSVNNEPTLCRFAYGRRKTVLNIQGSRKILKALGTCQRG